MEGGLILIRLMKNMCKIHLGTQLPEEVQDDAFKLKMTW